MEFVLTEDHFIRFEKKIFPAVQNDFLLGWFSNRFQNLRAVEKKIFQKFQNRS